VTRRWWYCPAVTLAAVGLGAAGLAGCSSPPSTPPPPSVAPSVSLFPARPAVLRPQRAQSDPCGLLTPAQVSQLGANPGTRAVVDGQPGSYNCLWMRYPAVPDDSWAVRLDTAHDAAHYLSSSADIVQVSGFGAVQTTTGLGQADGNCQLYIDVAPRQSLEVQYDNFRGDRPGMNHQLACQLAARAADLMLANLRAAPGTG
jgi:hypothetical protein